MAAPVLESAFRACWRTPAAPLRPYVSAYTGYRQEAAPPSVHQGVASAHLTFLICLDGRVEVLTNADPSKPPGSFVSAVGGLHDAPARIAQGEPQTGLQLRLTWRGARALLGVPAGALAGDTVGLDALLGRRAAAVTDRLASADGWPERFALLDDELTALLADGPGERGVRPEVGYAWDRLTATGGTLRVEELARELGWSRRHLTEKFRTETGLGLKAAARLIRFEAACDRLRAPDRPSLAQVAAEAGYADQAHLSRDFRDLAGEPATKWLSPRLPNGALVG
ncbi:helix-turn-helix domain-containing protein [Pseudonocardia kunmingensis]|uniref:AraC family transcriptional regulator n=1 Tax=Pseudonocardia kunmingensis TaxID=630975 RepID=A0A543DYF2_9PSEU|nr:helix-turn-helix domain-containing protein [Pseudonocardia kunmingensis]TQM14360.1 AraC family transcriptional regulator [Pseudonocardia kunmingensis]